MPKKSVRSRVRPKKAKMHVLKSVSKSCKLDQDEIDVKDEDGSCEEVVYCNEVYCK